VIDHYLKKIFIDRAKIRNGLDKSWRYHDCVEVSTLKIQMNLYISSKYQKPLWGLKYKAEKIVYERVMGHNLNIFEE
jgi:hypothetical protein